ncbi:MAG: hypothetical protein JST16_08985 [Bdellovibrionales bacterium]|nr:hypothetical protein [Bdellovibrionales bacterium]
MTIIKYWVDVASAIAFYVIHAGVVILLFHCGRNFVHRLEMRKTVIYTSVCLALVIGESASDFYVGHLMEEVGSLLKPRVHEQLPRDWANDKAPEDREKSSRLLASMAYTDSGKILEHVDRNGDWRPYCPTSEDAELIRERVAVKTQNELQVEGQYGSSLNTLAFGFTAILLGVGYGWDQKNPRRRR